MLMLNVSSSQYAWDLVINNYFSAQTGRFTTNIQEAGGQSNDNANFDIEASFDGECS